jgi:hypothetical protein
MRIGDKRNVEHVRLGVTTADFGTMMAAAKPHSAAAKRVRAAAKAAQGRLRKAVEKKDHRFAILISSAAKRMKAKVPAFVAQFGPKAPKQHDGQMLHYVVRKVPLAQGAGNWLNGVKAHWHVVTNESFRTTDEQKAVLCAIAWFEAPPPPKPKVKLPAGIPDEETMDARIADYVAKFGATGGQKGGDEMLGGTVRGVALQPINARSWLKGVRGSWHVVKNKSYATTAAQKARFLALPSFTEPKFKTESEWVMHVRNGVQTLVSTGKLPTAPSGPTGKGLQHWKSKGLPDKEACDAAAAEVLATVTDPDERAKFQAIYDAKTQLSDMQKRKRAECVAKEAAKAAKKTRVEA